MDIIDEGLTYDGNGDATYSVQIRNFHQKMKTWNPSSKITTEHFTVQDVEMYLIIYPNGANIALQGNVSLALVNVTSKQVFLNYEFQIGDQRFALKEDRHMKPNGSLGILFDHFSRCASYKPDEELVIKFKITKLTIDKVVWDMYKESKMKFEETKAELVDTKTNLVLMRTRLDEFERNNHSRSKLRKPECPICFEEMSPDTKIAQCLNGHLLCWSCKEKMEKKKCPSCGLPVNGRAFGMENYVRSMSSDE